MRQLEANLRLLEANLRQLEAVLSHLEANLRRPRPAEAIWKRVKLEARQAGSELKPAASQLEASQAGGVLETQPAS